MIDGLHSANIVPEATEPIAVFIKNTESDPVIARLLDTSKSSETFNKSAKNAFSKEKKPLADSVNKGTFTKDTSLTSSKKDAKKLLKPSPADILNAGALDAAVPMGFLLLHNDISELSNILSKQKKNNPKKGGGLVAGLAGAAVGGLAGAAIASTGPELAPILSDPSANKQLVRDTYEIRLEKTKELLTAHYQHLIDGFADGGSFAKKAGDVFKNTIGGAVEGAGRALTSTVAEALLEKDPEVFAIRKKGFSNYLTAYYDSLLESFKTKGLESFLADVGGGLGQLVGSTTESVGRSATNVVTEALLNKDTDVYAVRKEGFSNYLVAYYDNLSSSLKATGIEGFLASVGKSLGNFTSGITEGVARSVTNVAVEAALSTDSDIYNIRKEGFGRYLQAYYDDLLQSFNKGGIEGWLKSTGTSLGSLFGGVSEGVARSLTTTLSEAAFSRDPDILAIQKEGYKDYLQAYYSDLVSSFTKKGFSGLLKDLGKGIGGFFGGIVDSSEASIIKAIDAVDLSSDPVIVEVVTSKSAEYLTMYFNDLISGYSPNKLNKASIKESIESSHNKIIEVANLVDLSSDTAIVDIVKTKSREYIEMYYDDLISQYKTTSFADIIGSVGETIGSFFGKVFTSKSNSLESLLDPSKLINAPELEDVKKDKLKDYISLSYDRINDEVKQSFKVHKSSGMLSSIADIFTEKDNLSTSFQKILDPFNLVNNPELLNIKVASIKKVVNSYFDNVVTNSDFTAAKLSSKDFEGRGGLNETLKNSLKKLFKGIGDIDTTMVFNANVQSADVTSIKQDVTSINSIIARIEALLATIKNHTYKISEAPTTIIVPSQENPLGGL